MYVRRVRVLYPLKVGHIVLSVGHDPEKYLEPASVSAGGHAFEFRVSANRPFLYCKPYLIDKSDRHRACGPDNLVLLTAPGRRDMYPYFVKEAVGIITPQLELDSRILGRSHRLRIYLPSGYYENTLKRYPVIYMQDGKNLFFPEEAFLGSDWKVDETLELFDSMNAIDKTIVVGVYAENREEEYTSPGYRRYGRSLVEEVKPEIDRSFRTLTRRSETAVTGSSLGGVVSLYMAWQWPQIFGGAACFSSTFTWRDNLLQRVLHERKRDIKIYLDSGWPGDNYEVTLSMAMAFLERGFTFGSDLLYFVFPHAPHCEASWAARFHLPLQLFSGNLANAARQLSGKKQSGD